MNGKKEKEKEEREEGSRYRLADGTCKVERID